MQWADGLSAFGVHRSTFQYAAKQPNAWLGCLQAPLRRVSRENPELVYAKTTRLLKEPGWQVGHRLIQWLQWQLRLVIPPREPRERRRGVSTGLPSTATHRKEVWTWDFIHDTFMQGGMLRLPTVIDE